MRRRGLQQQGDTLLLHYSSADPVDAGDRAGHLQRVRRPGQHRGVRACRRPTRCRPSRSRTSRCKPIQYIAPGMIAYGIAVGAVFGAALTLITWREKKLLRRLRLAPVSTATVVGSRVTVSLAVALGAAGAVRRRSRCCRSSGLQLNGAWYMAVPLVIAGTLAFLAIGLLVGSIAKTAEGGSGLANLITLPMAFLSGAFIPLEAAPAWLVTVVEVPADGLPGGGHEGRDGAR